MVINYFLTRFSNFDQLPAPVHFIPRLGNQSFVPHRRGDTGKTWEQKACTVGQC